ncbi:hypothetical protein [Haladaptatus sp. T7]|uniref:hypothetical protein n=1 Tax=Haladaptatus sp. T7 TaxID=2029368 RepID=UPI0021A2520F|nr:hypothetical protein [Haladaptatus sp. T7]GKZ12741.1 hypothetical protein HAL_06220 [Haladaptatus sp. T7]
MERRVLRWVVVLALVFGTVGGTTAAAVADGTNREDGTNRVDGVAGTNAPSLAMQEEVQEEEEGENEAERENGGAGAGIVPEWWGFGGEAAEAAYVGLAELGVAVLLIGVLGYSVGKRTGIVPPKYRLRSLKLHEGTMLVGAALTVPHFLLAEEEGGVGSLVVLFLAVEVASGFYGRHLHRHVVRMGRGEATPAVVGSVFDVTNRVLFRRWRTIHVWLTVVTALVIALHVLTAVGD